MSDHFDLSIVLPALDEEGSLRQVLPRLRAAFNVLGVVGEIIVVDGQSRDGTVRVSREQGARVISQEGRGFGAALREGLCAARAPWVAVVDADGSHPPEVLTEMWAKRDSADLIIASRYIPGGSAVMPLSRHLLSRCLNIVAKWVLELPVQDSSGGFRLYRTELARGACALSDAPNFTVQQELLVGLLSLGGRVAEIPFRYEMRIDGRSKASALRLAPAYARMLSKLKGRRSRL
ncbi:MAG: glycosyltransferase family 2 protein [Elusimicrobiota bacterium]